MLFVPFPSEIKNIPEKLLAEAEGTIQECMCKWQVTQFKVRASKYMKLQHSEIVVKYSQLFLFEIKYPSFTIQVALRNTCCFMKQ